MPRNKMVDGIVRLMTPAEEAQADIDAAAVAPVNDDLTPREIMEVLQQHGSVALKSGIAAKRLEKSMGQIP